MTRWPAGSANELAAWAVSWDEYGAGADLDLLAQRDPRLARRTRRSVTTYADTDHGDVLTMKSYSDRWRQRIGEWRVVFTLDRASRTLVVLSVAQGKDAYRG